MRVFQILFDVVGPVFLVAFVGYLWARAGQKLDSAFVTQLVNTIATPCLIVDTLTRSGVKASALSEMAAATCVVMAITLAASYALLRTMGLPLRTFVPVMTWSNAGNMGLPLCLFAFGDKGLSLAIAYFAVSSLSNYTIAQGIAAGGMTCREILRMPIIYAIIIALACLALDWQLPPVLARATQLIGNITVPLMLLSLGYSLAALRMAPLSMSIFLSVVRLTGGFAIAWAVAGAFGMTGAERGVLVIQSAMPGAVLNYLFAAHYNNNPQEVAGIVIISTLLSLIFLPLFLWTVL